MASVITPPAVSYPLDQFPVTSPQKLARKLGSRQVWVPIGFRGRGLPGSGGIFDATNTCVSPDVSAWWTPSYGAVTAIKLVYAGFDLCQYGEVDRSATITGTCAVQTAVAGSVTTVYPASSVGSAATAVPLALGQGLSGNSARIGSSVSGSGIASGSYVAGASAVYASGTGSQTSLTATLSAATTGTLTSSTALSISGAIYPALLGGNANWTMTPRHDVYVSDAIAVALPAATQFFVRGSWTFSAAGILLASTPNPSTVSATGSTTSTTTRLSGEGCQRGTVTVAGAATLPITASNSGGGWWPPVAVLGLVTVPAGIALPGGVLIIGDSIDAGTGDNADAHGNMGYWQRAFGITTPWISVARGSTSLQQMIGPGIPGVYALSVESGITDVIIGHAHNDFAANVPYTTHRANLIAIAAPFIAAGKRVWIQTCTPTASSSDNWATPGNQTITYAGAGEVQRVLYNAYCRTGDSNGNTPAKDGFAGVIDRAVLVEDSANAGKWIGGAVSMTVEGTHPSMLGHQTIQPAVAPLVAACLQ